MTSRIDTETPIKILSSRREQTPIRMLLDGPLFGGPTEKERQNARFRIYHRNESNSDISFSKDGRDSRNLSS